MLKESIELLTQEKEITLKDYIKYLQMIFKEGGIKIWASFVIMQIFRVALFYWAFMYFIPEITQNKLLMSSIIATIIAWPLEVIFCWQISVKINHYFFGQLTGRP